MKVYVVYADGDTRRGICIWRYTWSYTQMEVHVEVYAGEGLRRWRCTRRYTWYTQMEVYVEVYVVCVKVYVVYADGGIREGIRGIRRWRYT